ncbi:MAG: hypothetical protein JW384_01009 [Nitrosomonadaceae bacterium]|nr:hypothetical protein [Nitrosomonadaceae bacterium]
MIQTSLLHGLIGQVSFRVLVDLCTVMDNVVEAVMYSVGSSSQAFLCDANYGLGHLVNVSDI